MTAPPSDFDDFYTKWNEQLELLDRDVRWLYDHRQIWIEMRDALVSGQSDHYFLKHYAGLYVASQSIGVRRLADPKAKDNTASLGRLVGAVLSNPEVLSRDEYLKRVQSTSVPDLAAITYDERFNDGQGRLDLERAQAMQERLSKKSERVRHYADKNVAHVDMDAATIDETTFDDLDQAIDTVGEIRNWLMFLIRGASPRLPTTIVGDWKSPFRRQLLD